MKIRAINAVTQGLISLTISKVSKSSSAFCNIFSTLCEAEESTINETLYHVIEWLKLVENIIKYDQEDLI